MSTRYVWGKYYVDIKENDVVGNYKTFPGMELRTKTGETIEMSVGDRRTLYYAAYERCEAKNGQLYLSGYIRNSSINLNANLLYDDGRLNIVDTYRDFLLFGEYIVFSTKSISDSTLAIPSGVPVFLCEYIGSNTPDYTYVLFRANGNGQPLIVDVNNTGTQLTAKTAEIAKGSQKGKISSASSGDYPSNGVQ